MILVVIDERDRGRCRDTIPIHCLSIGRAADRQDPVSFRQKKTPRRAGRLEILGNRPVVGTTKANHGQSESDRDDVFAYNRWVERRAVS